MDNIKLNDACKEHYESVLQKGFTNQLVSTKLMLVVTELGEACEADRTNKHADYTSFKESFPTQFVSPNGDIELYNVENDPMLQVIFKCAFESSIKNSFEDEIADAILRLMDLCGEYNIDIEKHIKLKSAYNKIRPYKHGKEY